MSKNSLYTAYCVDCGQKIEDRFFVLDEVLQYYKSPSENVSLEKILKTIKVGAIYGEPVLVDAPSLLQSQEEDADCVEGWSEETFLSQKSDLPPFCCADDAISTQALQSVNLNISNIVAQFVRTSKFYSFYELLTQYQKKELAEEGEKEKKETYSDLLDKFTELEDVNAGELSNKDQRRTMVEELLANILALAKAEAEQDSKKTHMALYPISIGWRYHVVNEREVPASLVCCSGDKNVKPDIVSNTVPCCPHCHQIVDRDLGAYPQRIVGVLGLQSAGKTTFLAALTDVIDVGNMLKVKYSGGGKSVSSGLSITHAALSNEDLQWQRFMGSSKNTNAPLYLYQHGFAPEKTAVTAKAACAISFKVKLGKPAQDCAEELQGSDMVIYTFVDVPGEAFLNEDVQEVDQKFFDLQKQIIKVCDAFFLMVGADQVQVSTDGNSATPNSILAAYKRFLPENRKKTIPTMIALTKADLCEVAADHKPSTVKLRRVFNIASNMRLLQPLVEVDDKAVYNAEAMYNMSNAVFKYLDDNFSEFATNVYKTLKGVSKEEEPKVSACAISNGTQAATPYPSIEDVLELTEASDENKPKQSVSDQITAGNCQAVRASRFGVENLFLHLLAQDGLLPVGRYVEKELEGSKEAQAFIEKQLKARLYYQP